jgi:uncharacterized protein involved in exopolysaccharide biosynthesis
MKQHGSSYWLELLWRRRRVALWTGAGVFALILLGTIAYPPLYDSSAQILVQSNRAHYIVSPALQSASDPNAPVVTDRAVTEQDLNSEIELLTQRRLVEQALADVADRQPARGVVRAAILWVAGLPGELSALLHGGPRPSALQRRAIAIRQRIGAAVIRKSNMLEVSYRSRDAAWSREFLAALLNRYFELHSQIAHDSRSERFFQAQSDHLRERLRAAEEHLRALRDSTGILSLSDQSEAIVYQLSGFRAEYRKNTSRLDGVNRQIAALEAGLKQAPMRLLKEIKSAPNPAYETLKPKVLGIEMNRDDILQRYKPTSKTAQAVTEQVNQARSLLERENHTEVVERLSDLSPVWLGLSANLAQARVTAAALTGSQRSLALQIDRYESELRRLADDGVKVEQAMRDVDADKEAYISYLHKGEEARAELALNQSRIMNVVLAMPPSEPLEPAFPKLELNLAAGLLLAIIAALAAAWWEERLDPTIYSVAAAMESANEPVVAVLRALPGGRSARA